MYWNVLEWGNLCSLGIFFVIYRLASVGILGKEREPGIGKLGWHGNFDTGFERNTVISFKNTVISFRSCGFFELF